MKKRNLILMLCFFCMTANAQVGTLCNELSKYKDICLKVREGIVTKNTDILSACSDSLNDSVGGIKLSPFSRFTVIDEKKEVPLTKHLQFTHQFIDSLLVYGDISAITIDVPPIMRKAPYDCEIEHRALAPKSKGVYSSKGAGHKEILVVAEDGGHVNLFISDLANNKKLSATSPKGKAATWISWDMDSFGDYQITVENVSDKPISFVIAGN